MSETLLVSPAVAETSDPSMYEAMLQTGLEQAQTAGFDLPTAIGANYAKALPEQVEQRTSQVLRAATEISHELGLQPAFFERPANVVLLTAIADSWVGTEDKAGAAKQHDPKIADERAMLGDIALILGGKNSQTAREIGAQDRVQYDRYVEEVIDPDTKAKDDFFETINDTELAEQVKALFNDQSETSLLYHQREMLGIDVASEQPFDVKVLKVGNRWDLETGGVLQRPAWPTWEGTTAADKQHDQAIADEATRLGEVNNALAAPYQAAEATYDERFGEKFGPIPMAYVNRSPDNKLTLYLRAADAAGLINNFGKDEALSNDIDKWRLTGWMATARHEYSHTQKNLLLGPADQLGLVLEERKAELVSGDNHGYEDIKFLMTELDMTTQVDVIDGLKTALTTPDALSTFLAWSGNKLGLRNTLLLMADKPLDGINLKHARRFADLSSIMQKGDLSTHDAIIRENIGERGDASVRASVANWVGNMATGRTVEGTVEAMTFYRDKFVPSRLKHGLHHVGYHMDQALNHELDKHQVS